MTTTDDRPSTVHMASRSLALSVLLSSALWTANAAAQDEPPVVPVGLPPPPGVPRHGPPPPPAGPTRMWSPIMVGIGSGLVVTGVTSIVTGAVFFWIHRPDPYRVYIDASRGPDIAAIIGGGIVALIGIPIIAIGAHQVPAGPPMARLIPKPGPGGTFAWTF